MKILEDVFGIKINNTEFYEKALSHTSYTKEKNKSQLESYERLEFLGDAVLKLTISDILFKKFPEYNEGELSKIRSIIVSDSVLFEIVKDNNLAQLIKLGKHEEKQGCRDLESICACAFEALLGAFYLDGKHLELLTSLEKIFMPIIEDAQKNSANYNAKALLQEYTQSINKDLPSYILKNTVGPDHKKSFVIEVLYHDEIIAQGEGKTKKEAEQMAALLACKKFGVIK
ncbi:MAG: ribonuclease III [Candidatus Gastranaerophilales bacterium]